MWIVVKSEYFGFSSDVYLGTVYLVPEGSSHEHEDLIAPTLNVFQPTVIIFCAEIGMHAQIRHPIF